MMTKTVEGKAEKLVKQNGQGRALPEGWRCVQLGDISQVASGVTLGRKLRGNPTLHEIPYLRVANVKDGYLDLEDIKTIEATQAEIDKSLLQVGDILLTEGGDPDKLGRGTFWDGSIERCIHQNHIFRVRFDHSQFLPEFVSAQISSPYGKSYFLAHAKQTTGIATINQQVLKGFPLILPPIAEQKRIMAILSDRLAAVDKARLATQTQLEAAQALPAAYLRQIFNSPEAQKWEKKPLGDVAEVGAGITLGRKFKEGTSTRQIPYLRVANVKDGYLDLSNITSTEATEAEIKKCLLQYGDILLTEGGDPDKLGRGTYWQNELPECIHQNHIFRVRFDLNEYVPSFLSAQIGSAYGKAYFLANAKQTTGIATINQQVLKGFPIMSPSIETQKKVVLELEEALKQSRAVEKALQDQLVTINALPSALLRQAFNGEL